MSERVIENSTLIDLKNVLLFWKVIETLLWIFSFAIGANGNISVHHYRHYMTKSEMHSASAEVLSILVTLTDIK